MTTRPAADEPGLYPHRTDIPPDRLVGRGHPAADFLEAYDWVILEEEEGRLRVDAHLPAHTLNPQGQLFGGFTGAYVDMVSLQAVRAGPGRLAPDATGYWTTTINMRIDYYEPIVGPRFVMEAEVEHRRGRNSLVVARLLQDDALAAYAISTLRTTEIPLEEN